MGHETTPRLIEHLIDTHRDEKTGHVEFHYNYLLYTFDHPSGPVTARCYLDTPDRVSLLQVPATTGFEDGLEGIIAYLDARFARVQRLKHGKYTRL